MDRSEQKSQKEITQFFKNIGVEESLIEDFGRIFLQGGVLSPDQCKSSLQKAARTTTQNHTTWKHRTEVADKGLSGDALSNVVEPFLPALPMNELSIDNCINGQFISANTSVVQFREDASAKVSKLSTQSVLSALLKNKNQLTVLPIGKGGKDNDILCQAITNWPNQFFPEFDFLTIEKEQGNGKWYCSNTGVRVLLKLKPSVNPALGRLLLQEFIRNSSKMQCRVYKFKFSNIYAVHEIQQIQEQRQLVGDSLSDPEINVEVGARSAAVAGSTVMPVVQQAEAIQTFPLDGNHDVLYPYTFGNMASQNLHYQASAITPVTQHQEMNQPDPARTQSAEREGKRPQASQDLPMAQPDLKRFRAENIPSTGLFKPVNAQLDRKADAVESASQRLSSYKAGKVVLPNPLGSTEWLPFCNTGKVILPNPQGFYSSQGDYVSLRKSQPWSEINDVGAMEVVEKPLESALPAILGTTPTCDFRKETQLPREKKPAGLTVAADPSASTATNPQMPVHAELQGRHNKIRPWNDLDWEKHTSEDEERSTSFACHSDDHPCEEKRDWELFSVGDPSSNSASETNSIAEDQGAETVDQNFGMNGHLDDVFPIRHKHHPDQVSEFYVNHSDASQKTCDPKVRVLKVKILPDFYEDYLKLASRRVNFSLSKFERSWRHRKIDALERSCKKHLQMTLKNQNPLKGITEVRTLTRDDLDVEWERELLLKPEPQYGLFITRDIKGKVPTAQNGKIIGIYAGSKANCNDLKVHHKMYGEEMVYKYCLSCEDGSTKKNVFWCAWGGGNSLARGNTSIAPVNPQMWPLAGKSAERLQKTKWEYDEERINSVFLPMQVTMQDNNESTRAETVVCLVGHDLKPGQEIRVHYHGDLSNFAR